MQKTQIVYPKRDKVLIKVSTKYINFTNIFSSKLAIKLLKYIGINDHTIELINNKQSFYGPNYSLGPVNLEILKTYIKNHLTNTFI